jgi:hypothetical protein
MGQKDGDKCQQKQIQLTNKAKAEHERLLGANIFH